MHILHSVLGIITALIFATISLLSMLILYEAKQLSNDPSARIHARNDFYLNCFKLVCIFLTTFCIDDVYRWLLTIFMLAGSVFLYIKFRREKPFYHDIYNKIAEVIYCIFIWACFCLIIVMASEDSHFNGGMQVFIIVIPLIGIIVVTRESRRHALLLKSIDEFDNPDAWYLKIRYYLDIVQHKEANREAAVQLNGFMFHHEELCTNASCPLKSYMNSLIAGLKDKKKKQQRGGSESYLLLMNYAKYLFNQGVKKFPNSSSLHIAYAAFLNDRVSDKTTAINELNAAEKSYPQFDEQFLIFRYRKILEDETIEVDEEGGTSLDVVSMLAYENYLKQFKEAIEASASLHMEFWLELLESEPDLGKLDVTGVKINSTILLVQERWEKVQKINQNVPKALKLYADYLIEILNNNEEGSELLSKIKNNKFTKTGYSVNIIGDASALGMGELCATMGGADGTPCIVASGEPGKIGEILQFNMSTCRLFGYIKAELFGKKVSFLMPEVYAKYHDNILQSSLDKMENSGSNKYDRFVLGRHKSGYLIALPMQTRVIISVKQGAFFVATFRYEKKSLNATYLLLNEHKDIIGVTSKAVQSLGLTNSMLRNYRISAFTLAPGLTDKSMTSQYASKTGGPLDFYRPDVVSDAEVNSIFKNDDIPFDDTGGKKLRVKASKDFIKMNCIMTEVSYNTHIIGYIVRLEPIEEQKPSANLKQAKPQYNLQFVFDPSGMRYLQQDCEEDAQELISKEMSEYVNILRDKSISNYSQNKSDDEKPATSAQENTKEDDLAQLRQKLEQKKKGYIEDVNTYRWVNGLRQKVVGVQSRLLEREREEQKELEEIQHKEESGKKIKEDAFSALKSYKIFIETLNDQTVPPSVQRLKYVSYLILLIILTICSVEFGLSVTHYSHIEKNIALIRDSYRQIVAQMQVIFYTTKITLLVKDSPDPNSEEVLANIVTYRSKIQSALDEYYSTQNSISLSTLSTNKEHKRLFKEKVVYLSYNGGSEEDNEKYYTLPEAIQQMSSEIFTILSFNDTTKYTLENDDIYFVLYNGFADLYDKMKESTNLYVAGLVDRGKSKTKTMIIIFSVELSILILSICVVFPMVAAVTSTRLEILALFFDLPQSTVRELQHKCEKFSSQNKEEEERISVTESNAWLSSTAKTEAFTAVGSAQGRKRRYKNNKTSNAAFYINYILGMLIIAGYSSVNFIFGYIYLRNVNGYSRELNATSVSHSESFHAITILQQLLGYGQILTMNSTETFDYLAHKEITDLYAITQETQVSHNEKGKSFTKTYQEAFINIMRGNLCNFQSEFEFEFNCDNFLEGTTKEGLHPVLINFIETMREILTRCKDDEDKILIKSVTFDNMETSIFEITDPSLRYLVDELIDSHDSKSSNDLTQRVILYVVFLLLLFIAFLAFWSPFTSRLSNEVS